MKNVNKNVSKISLLLSDLNKIICFSIILVIFLIKEV